MSTPIQQNTTALEELLDTAAELPNSRSGVHIGPEAPTGDETVWIDTDEEAPAGNGGGTEPTAGKDGFSPIATVEQTADGAVVSITDKNGTTTATISNGEDGTNGKTAYQYAQDGGYTGTEEEFAAKLAQETAASGIHIGTDAPADENVNVWIDTDEEPEQPSANPGGGTAVAQSDWNAVEGEPGHVLNRTHYENGTETKTLLDTSVTVASNQFQSVGYVPLAEDNTYTVTWDGAEYECVAYVSTALGFPAPSLGNPYFSGGENNGMPFGFVSASEYGQYGGAAMTNGSHTIKITEEVKAYKKLDECYLPSGLMPYVHKVSNVTLKDGKPSHATTNIGAAFDVIANALWNGGRVILDFTSTELVNEGFYKAEVTEWRANKQSDGSYAILLYYQYDGNRGCLPIIGGTWAPPTE